MAKELKVSGYQVDASIVYLSENKKYSEVGCFLPRDEEFRALKSQLKMR